jgi:hypothetical protein
MTDHVELPSRASDSLYPSGHEGWIGAILSRAVSLSDHWGMYPVFAVIVVFAIIAGASFMKSENMWGAVVVAVSALVGVLVYGVAKNKNSRNSSS